jgi:clan AA aspartic protease
MITGSVNSRREAIIQLEILGHDGQRQAVDAVIDTGFNGFLTLPGQVIATLGLRRFGSVRVVLVDGSEDLFPTYKATVMWDGAPRDIEVDATDSDPLAGMALFARHELRIKVVTGGSVTIEAMP